MDLKNLSHHTQRSYLNAVTGLAKHHQQPPETIAGEMVEAVLSLTTGSVVGWRSIRSRRE